jgi:hypothetical protein
MWLLCIALRWLPEPDSGFAVVVRRVERAQILMRQFVASLVADTNSIDVLLKRRWYLSMI